MMVEEAGSISRICPECESVMTLTHKGHYSTLYVCPTCGSTLTIPPPMPAVPPKPA